MRNKILLGLTLLWPLASWAADDFKPLDVKLGLWESTVTTDTAGAPPIPEEVLSKMTPEQRARMEAVIKGRQGAGPQSRVTKSCLTKEVLDKSLSFGDEGKGECKRTVVSSSSSKRDMHLECTNGAMKSSGDIHMEAINSENIKGSSTMNVANAGRNMSIKINYSAKWISADCGDLKKK